MTYKLVFKSSVARDLKKIDKSEARKILDKVEDVLSEKPDDYPVLKGQFAGFRRFRIGDYRVIYVIMDDEVMVLRIAHRKEVYK